MRKHTAMMNKNALLAFASAYAAFRAYRALTSKKHLLPKKFSVPVTIEQEEDEGAKIRVNPQPQLLPHELAQEVIPYFRGTMTMWDIFEHAAHKLANEPLHGTLNADCTAYEFETYASVYRDIKVLAQGMEHSGLFGQVNDEGMRLFGLFGPNSSDWAKLEYAAMSQSVTLVTLYTQLTNEGVAHVLNLTKVSTVACLTETLAERCLDANSEHLQCIVVVERTAKLVKRCEEREICVITVNELRKLGSQNAQVSLRPPKEDTIWTFCFTSGSTGLPKGALLNHLALVTNIASMIDSNKLCLRANEEVYLSFLPLAHQMERTNFGLVTSLGGRIGFARGDPAKIMDDVKLLRPTFFVSVPRLLNRLAKLVEENANKAGFFKRVVFNFALETKIGDLTKYGHFTHPIWDRVVFAKVRKQLGLDRCRVMMTGSAPIAPRTLDLLRIVFSVPVNEGYGQTEANCAITFAHPLHVGGSANRPSHVGGPIRCVEVKLVSVPEMKYLVSDRVHDNTLRVVGRGEVLCRAKSTMLRYYHNLEKTKQTVDEEGWLHTGDIGAWLEDGTLSIIDRANNIFKTSIGEYIQPDKIERAICSNANVQAAFVFGTPLNSRVVAIVVLAEGVVVQGEEEIKAELVATCKARGLLGFEVPAAFAFTNAMFTIESGVLTATSKIVRSVAKEFFKPQLIAMFAQELNEEVKI